MADTIDTPKNDSLTISFLLQDASGAAVDFDSASLTVKGGLGTSDYVLAGVKGITGAATFTIPANALAAVGTYAASVVAITGTTERNTMTFSLRVTDHA
jgi:hypothetical protein